MLTQLLRSFKDQVGAHRMFPAFSTHPLYSPIVSPPPPGLDLVILFVYNHERASVCNTALLERD